MFGHSQFASHAAYFVLEQPLQRFAQTEVHLLGQTAHVVMALDGLARNVYEIAALEPPRRGTVNRLGCGTANCPNADAFFDSMISFPFQHWLSSAER